QRRGSLSTHPAGAGPAGIPSARFVPMSVQAIAWAFEQYVPQPGAKLVLLALANFANEHGVCWPSQETISELTSQGVRTVRRHLATLEEMGMIARQARIREDGTYASDAYHLLMGDHGPNLPKAKSAAGQNGKRRTARSSPAAKSAAGRNGRRPKTTEPAANLAAPTPPTEEFEPSNEPGSGGAPPGGDEVGESGAKSWSTVAGEIWEQCLGGVAPFGRIGKALKPLVERYGEQDVLVAWRQYLEKAVEKRRAEFATPEDFAARYGYYRETGEALPRNATGRRRTTDPQQYGEGLKSVEEIRRKNWRSRTVSTRARRRGGATGPRRRSLRRRPLPRSSERSSRAAIGFSSRIGSCRRTRSRGVVRNSRAVSRVPSYGFRRRRCRSGTGMRGGRPGSRSVTRSKRRRSEERRVGKERGHQ